MKHIEEKDGKIELCYGFSEGCTKENCEDVMINKRNNINYVEYI